MDEKTWDGIDYQNIFFSFFKTLAQKYPKQSYPSAAVATSAVSYSLVEKIRMIFTHLRQKMSDHTKYLKNNLLEVGFEPTINGLPD